MDDDWFPRSPALRPGVRVVRRGGGRLQVGFHPAARVSLPDLPAAHGLLRDVAEGRRPDLEVAPVRRWARALTDQGLVVDRDRADALSPALPRAVIDAALAQHGPDALLRLSGRVSARIGVEAPPPWRDAVALLVAEAGLRPAVAGEPVTVQLVVSPGGELPRSRVDAWMRSGLPHLVVTNLAARARVGPFVAPGLTACLRCLDAHLSDRDPGHGLVVEQHPPDPLEPCDPLLLRLALACAVRDLTTYVEGDLPTTWSATLAIGPGLGLRRRALSRHARCGCAWGEELAAG